MMTSSLYAILAVVFVLNTDDKRYVLWGPISHVFESLTPAPIASKVDRQSTVRILLRQRTGGTYEGDEASDTQINVVGPVYPLSLIEAMWRP